MADTDCAYRFQLLGPVRLWCNGNLLDLGPPKQRALLALLLLNVDSTVRVATIVETIWGERPPRNVNNTVQSYISRIRRTLRANAAAADPLVTVPSGYRLAVDSAQVDLHLFRNLLSKAQDERRAGLALDALTDLERALKLWQEDALADLDESVRLRLKVDSLARHRRQAVIELAAIADGLGLIDRAVPALESQTEFDPTDEPVHARLMLAYASTGRRAAALGVFESIRAVLADTLGVDPSAELRQAHMTVLRL